MIHILDSNNSLVNSYLAQLRDTSIQGDMMRFRRNIERIGEIMELTDEKEFRLLELYELQ